MALPGSRAIIARLLEDAFTAAHHEWSCQAYRQLRRLRLLLLRVLREEEELRLR